MPKRELCEKDTMAATMETRASKRQRRLSTNQKNSKPSQKRRPAWRKRSLTTTSTKPSVAHPLQQLPQHQPRPEVPVSSHPRPDPSLGLCPAVPVRPVEQSCEALSEKNFDFVTEWLNNCDSHEAKPSASRGLSVESFFGQPDTASVSPSHSALFIGVDDTVHGPSVCKVDVASMGAITTAGPTREATYFRYVLTANGHVKKLGQRHLPEQIRAIWNGQIEAELENAREWSRGEIEKKAENLADTDEKIDETALSEYLKEKVFPHPSDAEALIRRGGVPMPAISVPHLQPDRRKVSTPRPDVIYGYAVSNAFSFDLGLRIDRLSLNALSGNAEMVLPFLVIEVEGGDGLMWVARNQVMGDMHTCLHITDNVNKTLAEAIRIDQSRRTESHPRKKSRTSIQQPVYPKNVDGVTFGITINRDFAKIWIAYVDSETDKRMSVECATCLIGEQAGLERFHCLLGNIIKWGVGRRLQQIKDALNFVERVSQGGDDTAGASARVPAHQSALPDTTALVETEEENGDGSESVPSDGETENQQSTGTDGPAYNFRQRKARQKLGSRRT